MSKTSVFWLTNLAPPYRRAVWKEIARSHDLTVALTGRDEAQRVWSMSSEPGEEFAMTCVGRSLAGWRELWRAVRRSDVVVLGGWHQPEYLAALLMNGRARPTVAYYESTASTHRFRSGPVSWVRKAFFRSVDVVLAGGNDCRDAVVKQGVSPERIVVGPAATDAAFFHGAAAAARERLTSRAGHHLVFVGQLIPRKNVEVALRAWAGQASDDDRFTIVGTGPKRERLETVAVELGVRDRVTFEDYREPPVLAELYADAQTLVLPSTEEVWGMVVNEALSAGMHVVLTDRSGAVGDLSGMRGVFVCPPTEDGVAEALERSRRAWTGPVENPEILKNTPEQFAEQTIESFALARTRHRGVWPCRRRREDATAQRS
jgi:glycosyltransferase involved in cell wall biosynthesis